ncbi:hypothetical protein SESBI_41165 [Sesbania bispinosa]|nr:hypothetical protein SESBI_41165 [Sesbania bispinosa]
MEFQVIKFLLFLSVNTSKAERQHPHLEYMSTSAVTTITSSPTSSFTTSP